MTELSFLETIRVSDGKAHHLAYHQARLEWTLKMHGHDACHDLQSLIQPPLSGIYRCRVVYTHRDVTIEYIPYVPKTIRALHLLHADTIEYGFKYSDRNELDALFARRGSEDDIAIVKNGLLTDTTIANIALFDGEQWCTPKEPLLLGTTRQRLLDEGKIVEKVITASDIARYSKVAVMNAMLGFVEVENGIIFPKV